MRRWEGANGDKKMGNHNRVGEASLPRGYQEVGGGKIAAKTVGEADETLRRGSGDEQVQQVHNYLF